MNEAVSDEGVRVLWSLLSSEDDATERKDHDHAKTTTTDHKNKKARHGAHNKTTTTDHAKTNTTDQQQTRTTSATATTARVQAGSIRANLPCSSWIVPVRGNRASPCLNP